MGRRGNDVIAVLSAALITVMCAAIAGQGKTAKDGVYTDEQSKRGQAAYQDQCLSCHAADLTGGGMAPALVKEEFVAGWADQKLDALFSRIKDTMPADKPGSLTPDTAADVIAFVLKSNGFPAGQQPLPADPAALAAFTIGKP